MSDVALQVAISAAALAILAAMSVWAARRFRLMDNLPMHWTLGGRVSWTAPRRIALAFIPVLALCVLAAAILSTAFFDARPGQQGFELPAVFVLALTFVGIHILHIGLIGWEAGRADR